MAWHQLTYPNFYATLMVHDYFVLVARIFLAVPRTRLKTYGDRAFSAAAPRLWNQLLPELKGVTSVSCRQLLVCKKFQTDELA